jgi:hypothetical protein
MKKSVATPANKRWLIVNKQQTRVNHGIHPHADICRLLKVAIVTDSSPIGYNFPNTAASRGCFLPIKKPRWMAGLHFIICFVRIKVQPSFAMRC